MGLEVSYLDFMLRHIKNNFDNRTDLNILELGNQIISPNDVYRFRTGKDYFQSLGYYHVSVDLNGCDGAEIRDLTKPNQFIDLYNNFDILTNAGTTEHVEPYESQFDCWKILHDCLKPTGLFLHVLPDVDELDQRGHWKGHCSYYYSHRFFETLSKNCNYEILESSVILGNRVVALLKKPNSLFAINKQTLLDSIAKRDQQTKIKLADIHLEYDTDKGTGHSYIPTYDIFFEPYRTSQTNILEIGALTCGSLKMFEKYFVNATIYGVDNWTQSSHQQIQGFNGTKYDIVSIMKDINNNHPRIKLLTCDSTNKDMVANTFEDKKFSVIIDDGDHTPAAQFKTYTNFIHLLDTNGTYIIEDVGEYDVLNQKIIAYNTENNLNRIVEVKKFFKQGRGDDVLIIIK